MENPTQQPNYFRFTGAPPEAPKPWFQRREVLKRGAIMGGVLIFVILLVIFAANWIKTFSSQGPKSAIEAAEQEVIERQADCDEGDAACKEQAQAKVARAAGIKEACEGLSEHMLQNCVVLIAQDTKDVSVCEVLSGGSQDACTDSVLLARAADGEGITICAGIQDATKKNSCTSLVTATARASGDCATYGVSEEVCDAQNSIKALLAAGNLAGCVELGEEERENCIDAFASADSDGDGYDDRTEIESGYNPFN
jgi:hypothetical protein